MDLLHRLAAFFTKIMWQDVATAVGVLFGIISTIAYWEQRKSSKAQAVLVAFAERHVAKDLSEETIKELDSRKRAMETEIVQSIPALARQAVLKEQGQLHAKATVEHFREWRRITGELAADASAGAIDPAFQSAIVDRLLPRFEQERKLDLLRNAITVLSVALALISALVPRPLNILLAVALALPLAGALVRFIKLQTPPGEFSTFLRILLLGLYGMCCVASGGFALFLFAIGDLTETGWYLQFFFAGSFLLLIVLFVPFRRRLERYLVKLSNATPSPSATT